MGRINLRSSRLFLRVLPVLVWLSAVLCVVGLYHRRTARFEIVGLAQPEVRQVAATCGARLISVPVQLFDKVSEGDTVAVLSVVLDDERVEAEMATIQAEMDLLEAQLLELRRNYLADVNNRESEWWAEMRAFTADVVMAKQNIIDANTTLENNLTVLEKMNQEITSFTIKHQADLGTDNVIYNQWQTIKANRDKLMEQVERDRGILAKYQEELKAAEERREKYWNYKPYAGTKDEDAQHVIDLAKEALKRRKDELKERKEKLVLTAPCDGYISDIPGRIGEAVMQGVEILRIAEKKPRAIIAYAGEAVVGQLAIGKQVEVVKGSKPPQIGASEVTYIGPAVEQMPQRLWRNPNFPQWGRPMLIEIPSDMKLIPGEMVGIRGL
ncbi:MAG: HlyD family secretion protein [Planctomycetota bacterium]|jgi:multidrug resistance efflux pump